MSKRVLGLVAFGAALMGCFPDPEVRDDNQTKAITPTQPEAQDEPAPVGPTGRPVEAKADDTEEELTPAPTDVPPPVVEDAPKPEIDSQRYYTIEIPRVMVAPGDRAVNQQWDSSAPIDPTLAGQLDDLLAAPNATPSHVLAQAATLVAKATNAPDVVGRVHILQGGFRSESQDLPKVSNSCLPQWASDKPVFHHIKIDAKLRVQVELYDADVIADDLIGTVDLDLSTLANAAKLDNVMMVPVYNQGNPNILYVGVNVIAE